MVLSVLAAALVCLLAVWVIARASVRITTRLGLDPVATLLWLGLMEREPERPRSERRRLSDLLVE